MTKRILMIHADALLARSLADQLTGQDFSVDILTSVGQAEHWLAEASTDLVLIDAQSTDEDAPAACRTLRACATDCPLIVLGVDHDGEAALKIAGANACLAKPYRFANLMQLLQDHLRDSTGGCEMPIGSFRLRPAARQLVDADGRRIPLTEKETAILSYLHRAGTRVVPREELLGEVWGYSNAVSTHTVETHIYRLRRKLAAGVGAESLLSTTGGGYRLN
jgi:DNA-binding response OmpR family regulator